MGRIAQVKARVFLRDGRAPIPKDARTSEVMSRIGSKNTKPEQLMRSTLSALGVKGYRLHYTKAPGRPDIAFVGRKIAVFVHGCFWHGCPHCQRYAPKTNRAWWKNKLTTNQARDRRKTEELEHAGWKVITVWECRLKRSPIRQALRVVRALG
jgi:DNA mismatch endonuclease (patch repair protein)